jgi:ABC-type antimicrobial peptide transport system permease subunit
MPVFDLKTLGSQLDETLVAERFIATLSAAFGVLATLLAAIGLYGVMAFVVERRTKELGLRMALGASQSSVVGMVMREVVLLLVIGLAIGVPLAYGLTRFISSQLFGVAAADPRTGLLAICVLAVVALGAGFLPARRASAIDPIRALRYE